MVQLGAVMKKSNFTGEGDYLQRSSYPFLSKVGSIVEAIWGSRQPADKSCSTIATCELIGAVSLWKSSVNSILKNEIEEGHLK